MQASTLSLFFLMILGLNLNNPLALISYVEPPFTKMPVWVSLFFYYALRVLLHNNLPIHQPFKLSSNRKVRLSASTIFLLRQLKGEQESNADERGTKWIDSGAVFTAWNGKQVNAVWASCWWRGWIRKTSLPIKNFTASSTPVSAC